MITLRLATILAGGAALALAVPTFAADQDANLPTCSATVKDNCKQADGHAVHKKSMHRTARHSVRHAKKHRKPAHHATKHHKPVHHATHRAATKTTATHAGTTTTTHSVAPKSGKMSKTSTTTHMSSAAKK